MQEFRFAPNHWGLGCLVSSFYLETVAAYAEPQDEKARAFDQLTCIEIEGPIEEAVRFVESETGETLAEVCIKIVPPEIIIEAFRSTAGNLDEPPEIGGLFVVAEQTVLIPSDLDIGSPFDLSFLVHEIAHYHQFQSGLHNAEARIGRLECDAYLMQAAFLRSRGLKREAFIVSLQAELQIGSVCEY